MLAIESNKSRFAKDHVLDSDESPTIRIQTGSGVKNTLIVVAFAKSLCRHKTEGCIIKGSTVISYIMYNGP